MRVRWAVLVSSASILAGSASVSAQGPVPLSGVQLDGVVPTYQYDPSRYQLRVAVEAVLVTDPDLARNTLLTDDAEAMDAQRVPGEEPEARCTPARRALLALAGRSELAASEATPQQGPALTTSAPPTRQAASAAASRRDQRLAAVRAEPAITGRSEPAAVANLGSNAGQATRSSRPPAATSAGAAGKRAPESAVASRAPQVEVPVRTVRSDNHARPSGASAVRVAPGANAADIVARVRSQVNRTLSVVQGGAFRLR